MGLDEGGVIEGVPDTANEWLVSVPKIHPLRLREEGEVRRRLAWAPHLQIPRILRACIAEVAGPREELREITAILFEGQLGV